MDYYERRLNIIIVRDLNMVFILICYVFVLFCKNMNYLVYYFKFFIFFSGIEKGGNGVESVMDEEVSF